MLTEMSPNSSGRLYGKLAIHEDFPITYMLRIFVRPDNDEFVL